MLKILICLKLRTQVNVQSTCHGLFYGHPPACKPPSSNKWAPITYFAITAITYVNICQYYYWELICFLQLSILHESCLVK